MSADTSESTTESVPARRTRLLRAAEHVRTQNWTAIGIDFLIVVLGVFVGIQVSNWNAARVDDAKADAYVARIVENLESDIESIKRREVFWTQVSDYGESAIRYAETGELVDGSAWKTVLAFYQASQVWLWATNDTTYQELLNSGELRLIEDEGLRSALPAYYSSKGGLDYLLTLIPEYRKIVRGLSPAVVSDQIWSQCHRDVDHQQFLLDCGSPMPEADAQAVLDAYMRHPELLAELRFWMTNQQVAMKAITGRKERAETMLRQMGVEPKTAEAH